MSVITNYIVTAHNQKNGSNTSFDMRQELLQKGILSRATNPQDKTLQPAKCSYTMDLSKCNPTEWEQELNEIKKRGVIDIQNPMDQIDEHGNVSLQSVRHYLSAMSGQAKRHYMIKDNNIVLKEGDYNNLTDTPLSDVELTLAKEQTIAFLNSYTKQDREDGYCVYRRDYTQNEIEKLSNPTIFIDQHDMSYMLNYKANDTTIAYYLSYALPDKLIEQQTSTEGSYNGTIYFKNGNACDPDGKNCVNMFEINKKCIPEQDANGDLPNKQAKLFLEFGADRKRVLTYIDSDQIFVNRYYDDIADVYLTNKDLNVYLLDTKTKMVVTPDEFVRQKNAASNAYMHARSTKQSYGSNIDKFMSETPDNGVQDEPEMDA